MVLVLFMVLPERTSAALGTMSRNLPSMCRRRTRTQPLTKPSVPRPLAYHSPSIDSTRQVRPHESARLSVMICACCSDTWEGTTTNLGSQGGAIDVVLHEEAARRVTTTAIWMGRPHSRGQSRSPWRPVVAGFIVVHFHAGDVLQDFRSSCQMMSSSDD
ncbi:hypothetical protein QBC45DRAFT_233141 [Copromyces sp. CBS 386.78]|nr:hypothetical protein QBC45DRAFT_233141 [Copromyces sp. CBS 386.78]